MAQLIDKMGRVPAAFSGMAAKINRLVSVANLVLRMEGGRGIDVKISDSNILISRSGDDAEGGGDASGRVFVEAVTTADDIPTQSEIRDALEAAYTAATPLQGDRILLTFGGEIRLQYTIHEGVLVTQTALRAITFTIGGDSFQGVLQQAGAF